jgi:arginine-tRNA-protein transferase
MKYHLDGRLIGVGVVDILPGGMSSVYFFYDHTFKEYRLGVFSSLLEIEYIKYLNKIFPEFRYYYMGFYIQNCQKMNYKGKTYI